MSKPVDATELSGLLDGELDPVRTAEVQAALEHDPLLRSQYDQLVQAHRHWMTAASSARFRPEELATTFGAPSYVSWVSVAVLVIACLISRVGLLLRPVELPVSLTIHALLLVLVLGVVIGFLQTGSRKAAPRETGAL